MEKHESTYIQYLTKSKYVLPSIRITTNTY